MEKKILFIGDEDYEPCKKALPVVKKIAEEKGVEIEFAKDFSELTGYENRDILDVIENPVIPTICEVDDNKIKRCIVGYSDNLEKEVEELIG